MSNNQVNPIVKVLYEAVKRQIGPRPAVYLSKGLDSTILAHFLSLIVDREPIHAYTFAFKGDENEFQGAERIAAFYGFKHRRVALDKILPTFAELQKYCERPRFNLWPYFLAKAACEDNRETCFTAEGLDEHFSGYWEKPNRSILSSWADHIIWIRPSYEMMHQIFPRLTIKLPFSCDNLDLKRTLIYWDEAREKTFLRDAFIGVIPDWVIRTKKTRGGPDWKNLWARELSAIYPNEEPETDQEIRDLLNKWITEKWVECRRNNRKPPTPLQPPITEKIEEMKKQR